ncbi:Amino acid/amide ABC transporter substrate-binding protein, haat family [Desulfamplus magnetovallimortis]|uniref:Amino acid/amide ABC transporter substrate-binding protein, haat family n=1 Tax=Desulfamplus magnetovallimortis TaxID=1246637 RepID=A0A1W1HDG7_9BACT|nr:ABC transporter substrate-binding protein [Desulfamplus magnetovallimortis]SLM30442.1 Amino acid/amide ABC transporter substrate-binding protein, haat family [Desulfamplus magnetovallimortis]
MGKTIRKNLFALNLFLAFAVVVCITPQAFAGGKVYKMGLSLAITGPTSDAGNPYSKGVEDYFNYVNDTKLLGDDKIECMIRDDQYQTAVTKRNFEDFLDQGIVFYLNYSTGSTLGLKRDFEEVQIPVLPASFHAGNVEDSHYIFLPIASYSEQVVSLSEYVVNNHKGDKPKVAMFIHPSAFGRGPVGDVEKSIAAGLNMEIVEVVEHGKDLDNTAMLQRLMSKNVQYVICQTIQSPVATMIKDAARLGISANAFGESGKITFLGAHYTGGNDLIDLAGDASENFFWITSYTITSEPGPGTDFQLSLAKKYGRDDKAANSHNYANGIMVAQVATEVVRRAKEKGLDISKKTLHDELNAMNGDNAYQPPTTVGPVTYSSTDRAGVDSLQIYAVKEGVFRKVGEPITSQYMKKIK